MALSGPLLTQGHSEAAGPLQAHARAALGKLPVGCCACAGAPLGWGTFPFHPQGTSAVLCPCGPGGQHAPGLSLCSWLTEHKQTKQMQTLKELDLEKQPKCIRDCVFI